MPTAHVRLKPIEWFQEIGHYPKQGGEGRYLRATCTYSDDSNVRLSTGETLSAFLAAGILFWNALHHRRKALKIFSALIQPLL